MKKLLAPILLITILFLSTTLSAQNFAPLNDKKTNITYLDDGSIITEVVGYFDDNITCFSNTKSISGYKKVKNEKDGDLIWEFILFADFSVNNGISSTCTNSYCSHSIIDSKWSIQDISISHSDNTAYGYCVFKKKVLFITTDNVKIDISLSCDVNGQLS